jgi:hypothetical protein
VASLPYCLGHGVGLSADHLPENTVTENSSGLDCVLNGGLSAVWAWTVRGSKDRKQKKQNRFWTRFHSELRTVRDLNSEESSRSPVLGPDSWTIRSSLADCPWVAFQQPQKLPQTQDRLISGRFKTNCHQIWTKGSQDSR